MKTRLAVTVAAMIAGTIAACGAGGEPVIHEDAVRDCLGRHGASFDTAGEGVTGYAPIFHVAADLQGAMGGGSINVFIEKSAERARGDAADANSALRAVGIQDPSANIVTSRNVVVLFDRPPTAAARDDVRSCLE